MRLIAVVLLIAGSTAWAQRGGAAVGAGRIGNTNGVTPPTGVGGFSRIVVPGAGAPAAVRAGSGVFGAAPVVNHGVHSGTLIVPYPVFYGGGYYNYDAPPAQVAGYPQSGYPQAGDQMQGSPVIIINQYFRPDTANPVLNDYTNVPLPEGVSRTPDGQPQGSVGPQDTQPIMFLIAMKDHTIYPALAYWVDGDTLNYITTQGTKNSASLDLVDRDFSQQLNKERKVDFGLPSQK